MRTDNSFLKKTGFPEFEPFWDGERQQAANEKVTGSVRLFLGLYRTEEESARYFNELRKIELP